MKIKKLKVRFFGSPHRNDCVFVVGQSGAGKTTLMQHLLLSENDLDYVVIDTQGQYHGFPCTHVEGIRALAKMLDAGRRKIVYHTVADAACLDLATKAVLLHQKYNPALGEITFVIDELGAFTNQFSAPWAVAELAQRGRLYRVNRIFGTQWLQRIPAFVRDTVTEIYAFRQTDRNALAFLSGYGLDVDEVRNLPTLHAFHVKNGEIERIALDPETGGENETEQVGYVGRCQSSDGGNRIVPFVANS